MTQLQTNVESDVDLFSAEVVDNPFPVYKELRDQGAAVYMGVHDFWLLSRYEDVRAADGDWQKFSSASGVALLPQFNALLEGSVLASDPPVHTALRAVLTDQLAPRAIRKLGENIRAQANELVQSVVAEGTFDAVTQLARCMPVQVVADLIGLPEEGRENLIPGADAYFHAFGPMTPELAERAPYIETFVKWMTTVANREYLTPGSWGTAILDAVDEGRLRQESAIPLISAFLVAGMDTTVNGIGSMLHVFADRPDVWAELQKDPTLVGAAFEEALRLEAPVQIFFRKTTVDVDVDGTVIPAGSRVGLHFGSANRDERHYPNPDHFDIHRNPLDHMAFGYGTHGCAGQGLARLEARAITEALLSQVETIEIAGTVARHYNPIIRGWGELPVAVRARKEAQ
ncbi:cytochrome P450 [Rhodococcoides fascians]|uniref:cytochrome P450 n=1 Tax=Rhodococcoides fascians TaxID=1828 RepID=UPI00050C2B9A|nr:cytochrome P450 [Rhodococcus fascians]